MFKIGVLLGSKANNGGSYQFWLSIVKALAELNKNQYVIIAFTADEKWISIAQSYGFKCIEIKEKNNKSWINRRIENNFWPYYDKPVIGKILTYLYGTFDCNMRTVRHENLDLYITGRVEGTGDIYNIPVMVPIFDLMHRYKPDFPEVASEYEMRERRFKHWCKYAQIILADSKIGKQQIIESYGNQRNDLAEHVEILPFTPPDYIYHKENATKPNGLKYEKYIFYPAQFWKHKNHRNLILAIKKLKDKGLDVKLILVGSEQNNRKSIEDLICENGMKDDVTILGYIANEEMIYLYQNARALVMPTFFGPTNIPPLEAFELGCPVATSKIYAIPEQLGDAALLFNPSSVDEIADTIERLWTDDKLCNELIEKGYAHTKQWGQKQFNELFKQIIENYKERR